MSLSFDLFTSFRIWRWFVTLGRPGLLSSTALINVIYYTTLLLLCINTYLPPLTLVPYLIQWLPQIPMYIPKYFLYPLDRRRAESGLTGPFLGDVPGVNLGVSLLAKRSNAVKMRRQLS